LCVLSITHPGDALTISIPQLGLNWGGVTYSWTSGAVLAPLILGVCTFIAFLFWEAKYAKLPIIPGKLFSLLGGAYVENRRSAHLQVSDRRRCIHCYLHEVSQFPLFGRAIGADALFSGMTYFTVRYVSTVQSKELTLRYTQVLYYIPQLIQLVRGSSAVTSSLLVLPFVAPIGE
jgi:hypothetical protein